MGAVEVSTTGTWRTRGAGERDDIVAHLVRLERLNARNEPGLVVDEQEYGALRRQALVGAAPGALGLVSRFAVAHAHNVLLLQKRVSCRAQPSAAECLKCVLPQATRHQQGLPGQYFESYDARYTAVGAMSSGCPTRPSGTCASTVSESRFRRSLLHANPPSRSLRG